MKKLYLGSGVILILAAIIFWGSSFLRGKQETNETWKTATVTRREIGSTVLATGIIKPMVGAEVRVGSRVSGIVQHLFANIGDVVQKGQMLAELDPTELQAKYDQASAALDNARANSEYAKADLQRKRSLFQQNLISQDELDLAEKSSEISAAQLKQAEANLAFARVQLDYTKITAPISGVIASVSTQEGETVAANFSAPTFVNIIDLQRLEVWAYVDETDIGRIQEGEEAIFTVDTYSETDFDGKVTAVYPKAVIQDNVVNYITTIEITDMKGKILRPEMTTTVTIFLDRRDNVLAVPNNAVKREQGQKIVYVLANGQTEKRPVKVGWKDNGYTEIISGVSEGETVVVGNITSEKK